MANTTASVAKTIHGTNPQFLIEKVIRSRIYDSTYWKEDCFALTAESLIDRAVELQYIGGTYGLQRPTPFLCLVCKLLQIQPDKEIILEYLRYEELKYLRAVAAMYARLTFKAVDVYDVLEPMLNDYRKLRFRQMSGAYNITHMDEFIDDLLTQERVCELILPRLTKRDVVEEVEGLPPRLSKLEDALLLGKARDAKEDDAGNASDASDESTREMLRQRRLRVERARHVRAEREMADSQRQRIAKGEGTVAYSGTNGKATSTDEEEDDAGYPSQEDSDEGDDDRHVSRSPSRSRGGSIDGEANGNGFVSRSPSRSPHRQGYVSRSPSRSPDRNGYISHSPSRSPDRV